MTEPACPVCATPHAPEATACDFCGVVFSELEGPAPQADASAHPDPALQPEAPSGEPASESEAAAAIGTEAMEAVEAVDTIDAIEVIEVIEAAGPGAGATPADAVEAPLAGANDATAEATPDAARDPAKPRARTPSFARATTAAARARRRQLRIESGVVAALALLLMLQVVAADFDQLAGNAGTRPWLQRACGVLRCRLPPWREPQALRMLQRDVRANPRHPGLLRISASFRNDARWAQPWPRLRVTLSDADGRAIAARDFAAREYLGAAATAGGIASGQVAGVAFDVVDPSPRVTAFTFEFR